MAKKSKETPAERAQKIIRVRAAGQRNYERSDNMLMALAAEVGVGVEMPLNDTGKKAVIIDRFDGKNIVWQPCAARRFELKIIES